MEYGSEYDYLANEAFLSSGDAGFVQSDWQLYRSGRDALKAFARIAGRKKALIPAMCCESMVLPFEKNGYEVEFYRLRENLSADEADVVQKLEPGCVLLYMRYFGIPSFSDEFLHSVRGRGEDILFLEDRTHDILTARTGGGFEPDAAVASLRKWTALPDGGMLATTMGSCEALEDGRFAAVRTEAMKKKSRYLANGDKTLKAEYMAELAEAAHILDELAEPVKMGPEPEKLLRHIDFARLMQRRVENVKLLERLLQPLADRGKLRMMAEQPENSTLYFTVVLENRDKVHRALIEKAIYAAVIWPLPEKAKAVCPVSRYVTEHMLAIPCDHRCGAEDMEFIASVLTDALLK